MPKAIETKAEFAATIKTVCPSCGIEQKSIVMPGQRPLKCECGNFGNITADRIGNGLADITIFWYWGG